MSLNNLVTISNDYYKHNLKCLQLPSEVYFGILREEDDYKQSNIYIDDSVSQQLKQIIENVDNKIRLTYNEQLFQIFNYDAKQLKAFLDKTKTLNDYDHFKQTILKKTENSNAINNLICSCWTNPFSIDIVDYKMRLRYHLFI